MSVQIKQISGLQDIIDTPVSMGVDYSQSFNVSSTSVGNNFETGVLIDYTPFADSVIELQINGMTEYGSYGNKLGSFYFSKDGGVTAKSMSNLEAGDKLYWNGTIRGFQLGFGDIITISYQKEYLSYGGISGTASFTGITGSSGSSGMSGTSGSSGSSGSNGRAGTSGSSGRSGSSGSSGIGTNGSSGSSGTSGSNAVFSGTLNKVAKFTGTGSTIGNSIIYDDGTSVLIGTTSSNGSLSTTGYINSGSGFLGSAYEIRTYDGLDSGNIISANGGNIIEIGNSGGTFNGVLFRGTPDDDTLLLNYTGNSIFGSLTDNLVDKVQINGYVKASGYKTPTGLSTQYLMADGSVSSTVSTGSTPVKLTSQTLSATSWTLVSGYYNYTFSNVNVTTTCDVSVTPQNGSYMTAYNAQILPYIGVANGTATFYSQFPPASDMIVDIVITKTI